MSERALCDVIMFLRAINVTTLQGLNTENFINNDIYDNTAHDNRNQQQTFEAAATAGTAKTTLYVCSIYVKMYWSTTTKIYMRSHIQSQFQTTHNSEKITSSHQATHAHRHT